MFLNRILIPVDFSTRSRAALRYAVGLARETGAEIDLLHVVPAPSSFQTAFDAYFGRPLPHASEQTRGAADAQLGTLLSSVEHDGVEIQAIVEEGDPAATIVQVATDGAYDLIILGTHGRIGLADLLLGSVAKQLITCAPCPVVTMRANETARA